MEENKVETIENENNDVTLIAGVINATGMMFYWKAEKYTYDTGNYALVENMNGYDLVKVVGVIETTKEDALKFSNTKYENMKKVVKRVYID